MTNNKVLIDALKEAKGALERSYDMTEYPATDDCCAAKAIRTIEAALASYAEQAPQPIEKIEQLEVAGKSAGSDTKENY